jgi:glycosyltransferase involved in cell wall biosynthesis
VTAQPDPSGPAARRSGPAAPHPDDPTNPVDAAAVARFDAEHPGLRLPPLVVVIAAFDEQGSVGTVVRGIPDRVAGLPVGVLVVVDGATDDTAGEARQAGALVCDVPVNRGQGAALRLGYLLARRGGARFVVTTDADGQYDPADLDRVVTPLLEGRADFVSGSRVLGTALTGDRTRRVGVTVFARLISLLTRRRITDPANGLRAMRAEVTAAVRLQQPQYQAAELLIGVIAAGFRVTEVPTTMRQRAAGTTKKGRNLAYGLRFGRVVLATWWRERGALLSPAKTTKS